MSRIERPKQPTTAGAQAAALAHVDLNLLLVLAVLLDEHNVTRTATRLGRTQSAVSHALDRLRETLKDPLFVRSGARMVPTPRAEALRGSLADMTARLHDMVLGSRPFDPAEASGRVRVTASDYLQIVMIPPLVQRMRRAAPQLALEVVGPKSRLLDRLSSGELDFSFSVQLDPHASLFAQKIFEDTFVCLVARDHPTVKDKLDRATYLRLPHVLIAPLGQATGHVDRELARSGERRNVAVLLPDFMVAPRVLQGTNLVLTLPRRVARLFSKDSLRMLEPPIDLPTITSHLVWHERLSRDAMGSWFRKLVEETARSIPQRDK